MTRRNICLAVWLLGLCGLAACRSDKRNAGEMMRAFVDEFYSGRAQSKLTSVVDAYTEWPDFAVGDGVQIAISRDLRLLAEKDDEASFEVRYKVIGEESRGKVEPGENEVVQTYRMRRRRGRWRILPPVSIPCVSVSGEVARLQAAIESASNRIAKNDFTEVVTREYLTTLISNAQASMTMLEAFRGAAQ